MKCFKRGQKINPKKKIQKKLSENFENQKNILSHACGISQVTIYDRNKYKFKKLCSIAMKSDFIKAFLKTSTKTEI
jgi:hypothetical protein